MVPSTQRCRCRDAHGPSGSVRRRSASSSTRKALPSSSPPTRSATPSTGSSRSRPTPPSFCCHRVLEDFNTASLDADRHDHLSAAATDLFRWHGLSSAELASPDIGLDAERAARCVCTRGLTTASLGLHEAASTFADRSPPVEIDAAIETPLRQLVRYFYDQLIKNLDNDLQVAIFGRLIVDIGEVKADVKFVRQWVEKQGETVWSPRQSSPFLSRSPTSKAMRPSAPPSPSRSPVAVRRPSRCSTAWAAPASPSWRTSSRPTSPTASPTVRSLSTCRARSPGRSTPQPP